MEKPYQVLYDYSDVPTLKRFTLDNSRVRCVMGPFGCVSSDTLIVTEKGLLPISEITRPMRVLSWNENKGRFQLSQSGGAFPKGKDYLYRVSTPQGSFDASGHHRVLCADNKYRQVSSLRSGDTLYGCFPSLIRKTVSEPRLLSHEDDPRFSEKVADWMGRYAELARQYGLSLLQEEDTGLTFAQVSGDVQILSRPIWQKDVQQSRSHTRLNQSCVLKQTGDSIRRPLRPPEACQGCAVSQPSAHIGRLRRQYWQRLLNYVSRHIIKLSNLYSHSFASPLTDRPIVSIERLSVKEEYWDMQVLDTNNYVTADGAIHHNSGKSSACVMEIIRRAHEQKASPDGIRRSRWAVVRNCYSDDTEILTEKRGWQLFKNLLPSDKVATLQDDHLIFKLPDKVVKFPYKGDMIGFENEGVNFLVTPEHKMWVSTRRTRKKIWGEFEVKTAEEIYGNQTVRVRRDAKWKGHNDHPEEFFEWLGFWTAEGSAGEYSCGKYKRLQCTITQKNNLQYVRDLFAGAKIPYFEHKYKNCITSFTVQLTEETKLLIRELMVLGKACDKKIPLWVKEANSKQIMAFLRGYINGDGKHSTDGCVRASTGSKQLADDIQELALRCGQVVNIAEQDATGRETIINGNICRTNGVTYVLTFLKTAKHQPILYVNPKQTNNLIGWHKKPYDGFVYCVEMEEVPVYVRRKGKGFWCVRSYGQLKDTTIKTVHDWFPPKLFGEYRVTDHMFIITRLPGIHLEILFRALDRPDQVSNLLSLEVTSAWFNESREIPRTIIEAMDARIGRFPSKRDGGPTWYGMIMDTNPPDEDSYLYKMFEKVKPDGWKMFKQPSGLSARAENTKHLPKGYYSNLAKGKDEMYKRIYIHGQYGFLVTGKPVFQSFVDNVHVAPNIIEPIKGLDVILGFDFGLQPACAIGQIDPMGKLVILDELVSDGMGLRQFCESQLIPLLRRKYFGMSVMGYGDPSGASRAPTDESTCFEVLHSREVGLSGVIPAPTNAIMPRVSAVETFLNKMWQGEPAFLLSPNCHFLRKALNGAYHYEKEPKSQGEEYKAMPVKNFYSHVSDALQMLCMYLSEKESQDRRWKSFQATMKRREYRPASYEAGY